MERSTELQRKNGTSRKTEQHVTRHVSCNFPIMMVSSATRTHRPATRIHRLEENVSSVAPSFLFFRDRKPIHSPQAHPCRATAATSSPNFPSISQPGSASCGHSGCLVTTERAHSHPMPQLTCPVVRLVPVPTLRPPTHERPGYYSPATFTPHRALSYLLVYRSALYGQRSTSASGQGGGCERVTLLVTRL